MPPKKLNSAQISATLAKAGHPRAGRYTSSGYVTKGEDGSDVAADGFVVMSAHRWVGPRPGRKELHHVTIVTTGLHHTAGQEQARAYAETLQAAGYLATVTGRNFNQVTVQDPAGTSDASTPQVAARRRAG